MNLMDFLSSSLMTRVAILDNDTLTPLFDSIHPMRVSVLREKDATGFVVESGAERSDHVVEKLIQISIDFVATDDIRNAYQALAQPWKENRLVTVQTKVDSFPNMLILAVPHDETTEMGGSISVPMRLQEWIEAKPETGDLPPKAVANKNQSSTVKRGAVKGSEADAPTQQKGSIMSGWFK